MRLGERGLRPTASLLVVALVALIAAVLLVASPRHRAFFFNRPPAPLDEQAGAVLAPPTIKASARSSGAGAPASKAAVTAARRVPLPDAEGRIWLPVVDRVPFRLPAEGVPLGWTSKEFVGRASVEVVRDGARLALRLRSDHSSFALYRDIVVDPNEFPYLTWSWKAVRLPPRGDVRERAADDQGAQVYVIFPRWPAPLTNSDVIGYVWDSRAPVGTRITSTKAPNVKIVVVESGMGARETWRVQERHVAQDYQTLFGRPAPRVGQVALMIDSDDTKSAAEALIGGLVFSRQRVENVEIPTSMLR
ncbi:MAG: hypothetical protein DME04_12000 [Candidatus Rokuibacteriota bacterium]|nr:MAG: hypothetical protein DME04_12000 [Candidatus Rokubacteria bacterium]